MSDSPRFESLRIIEKLATESVTEVFAAEELPLGRQVLLKTLRPNILPSSPFAEALEREARLLSELSHPGIQRLHAFHRSDREMWLLLERVPGDTLQTHLKRLGRLPSDAVVALGVQLAAALTHCHERGIVHRDLHARNVLITPDGRVILTGFVSAVMERLPTAPELLDGGSQLSTSPYLSPEQILGEPIDPRSDIYSLGVLLYEAVTGRCPFEGVDERGTAQRIRQDIAPPLSRFVPGLPGALERAIQRCLEKMPSDRFANMTDLAAPLERLLTELGVSSPERCLAAGIIPTSAHGPAPVGHEARLARPRISVLGKTTLGLVLCAALVVLGGFALQRTSPKEGSGHRASGRLELLPERGGWLRVLADPWARVMIDGQYFDTTPFARPIPLGPGEHYVHLEHPDAPPERRSVRVAPGETIVLEVKMAVPAALLETPVIPDAGAPPDPSASP